MFQRNKMQTAAALVSGLMLTGAFPNLNLSWLVWWALVPLFWSISGDISAGSGFRLGFVAGLVHYLSLMYWLVHTMTAYGGLSWMLAVPVLFLLSAYLSLFPAVFAWFVTRFQPAPLTSLILIPSLWTSLEFIRSFLLSGLPWGFLGYTQFKHLPLIQMADTLGVYGVSFLIVFVNVGISLGIYYFNHTKWFGQPVSGKLSLTSAIFLTIAVISALGYGRMRLRTIDAVMNHSSTRTIAAIQGNIAQDVKWDSKFVLSTISKYIGLSTPFKASQTDLIVWPESATPFYLTDDPYLTQMVMDGVKATGTDFLIGSPSFIEHGEKRVYHNSAYFIDQTGHPVERYDKAHLVPFGEYVPFKKYLPFLGKIVAQVGDFVPGPRGKTVPWGTHQIGVLICYELIFPELARLQVQSGASFLVNLTNDAWYGRTSAPYQHFSMAVFRAIENRRALVRVANTGISGFIDPTGRVHKPTNLFETIAIRQSIPLLSMKTGYVRAGYRFTHACLVVLALLFVWHFIIPRISSR
jgi:apolipoprotein N-acyltransferase